MADLFDATLRGLTTWVGEAGRFTGCAVYEHFVAGQIEPRPLRLSACLRDEISKVIREAVAAEQRIVQFELKPRSVLDIRKEPAPTFLVEIVKVVPYRHGQARELIAEPVAGYAVVVNERTRDALLLASEAR